MPSIRPAEAKDVPQLVEAWHGMLVECDLVGSGLVDDWRERLGRNFEQRMASGEAGWFVAEEDGRVVGTAAAFLTSGPSNIHKDVSAMLAGIYVEPPHRKRGIARQLTEQAIRWCEERGCVRVRLHASPSGRPLYESLGFEPATEMMRLDLQRR